MSSPIIKLEDLDVTLDRKKVLSSISWNLSSGERWAIAGPNGSGKTTFLKLIKGDIAPDLLILDELFNGLDEFYSGVINSILYRFSAKGRNIILSTHDETLPPYILIVMESGRVVEMKSLH